MLQARVFDISSCNFSTAKSKVQLENLFRNWGLGPPKGLFFTPIKTPQLRKKVAVNRARLCETYSPWSNKIFGENILDQGHPQVELLTKMFGRNSRKWLRQYIRQLAAEKVLQISVGRSVGLRCGDSGAPC